MLLRKLQAGSDRTLKNRMVVVRIARLQDYCRNKQGQRVFLPRIPHHDINDELPFSFVRQQFPVRLAFSVTISKGQRQENEQVGIYLPQPVFTHSQLYTTFSRGKRTSNMNVFIEQNQEGVVAVIWQPTLLYRYIWFGSTCPLRSKGHCIIHQYKVVMCDHIYLFYI